MSEPPFNYHQINAYESSIIPSTCHTKNTAIFGYYQRYLFQKLTSQFKWTFPDGWSDTYFLGCLYGWGSVAIFNSRKFGVIPQAGALYGYNVFYQPTTVQIANPLLPPMHLEIGKDCVLFRLQRDYHGALDLVNYYADLLATSVESLAMNIMNSKLSYVFAVSSKNAAQTGKELMDRVNSGELAVWVDKGLFDDDGKPSWQPFAQNVGQNYIADRILSNMRQIEAEFDTRIGIPTCNVDKKERLITAEAERNNVETDSIVAQWFDTIQNCIAEVKSAYNVAITCERRYPLNGGDDVGRNAGDDVQL
jgi:hypothetical protein